jgi:hypothetical protein
VTARAADWWNPITEDLVDLTSLAGGDRYQLAIANRRLAAIIAPKGSRESRAKPPGRHAVIVIKIIKRIDGGNPIAEGIVTGRSRRLSRCGEHQRIERAQ